MGVGAGGSVGAWVGVSVGGADGSTDGGADAAADGGGQGTAATPEVDGSGVGISNDGITPFASGEGSGMHDGAGCVPWQPKPTTMPHELPYGLNAPL